MTNPGGRNPVGERAVIADSWPMVRLGMATVLGGLGIRAVAEVEDASGVVNAFRQQRAELLLAGDVGSPTAELIRRVKSDIEGPVCVALLGSVAPDELRELLATGVSAVLPRGVGSDELRDVVRRALNGERIVSPALLPLLFDSSASDPDGAAESELTPKEREVIRLVAAGRSNVEIAATLFVSGATVKTHLAHIYSKLQVGSRHEALARAASLGLLH